MTPADGRTERLCRDLPHPLASSYFRFRYRNCSSSPYERAVLLESLYGNLFHYLAALCLSAYRRDRVANPDIDRAVRELERPSLGTWNKLVRGILTLYRGKTAQAFPVPELPAECGKPLGTGALAEARKQVPPLAGLEYQASGNSLFHFLDFLVWYRNRVAHDALGSSLPPGRYRRIVDLLEDALDELVGRLECLGDWPPISFVGWEGNRRICEVLQGASPEFRQQLFDGPLDGDPRPGDVFLCRKEGDGLRVVLPLSPLARQAECPVCGLARFFFLSQLDESRRSSRYTTFGCGHSILRTGEDAPFGLGGAAEPAERAAPAEEPPVVEIPRPLTMATRVMVDVHEAGGFVTRQAESGVALVSDDGFQVHVELNKDAHFCLLLQGSGGTWEVLFPGEAGRGADTLLTGSRQYQFPTNGEWYVLDDQPGTETLYLIAGEEPLDDVFDAVRARGDAVPAAAAAVVFRGVKADSRQGREAVSLDRSRRRPVPAVDQVLRAREGGRLVQAFRIDHRPAGPAAR